MQDVNTRQELKPAQWTIGAYLLGTRTGHMISLLVMAIALLFGGAVMWRLTGGNDTWGSTWSESFWFSWTVFFDPGTQTAIEAHEKHMVKSVAVVFSVLGFTFNLLLLGIIVEAARVTLEQWKKSHSRIVATGHTLLLGWSEKTLFLLREIASAHEHTTGSKRIVILAETDELEMRNQVAQHFPKEAERKNISFRTGCPHECAELLKVSASSAKNIIILGSGGNLRASDLKLIRTTVALASLPERPGGAIVAEVRHSETSHVIRSVLDSAQGVIARDAINRVMCLMAVDPAVGACYEDLISFVEGHELYCLGIAELEHLLHDCKDFGQACATFTSTAICVGVVSETAGILIAPSDEYPLSSSDKLLIIATDRVEITDANVRRRRSLPLASPPKKDNGNNRAPVEFDRQDTYTLLSSLPSRQPQTIILIGFPVDIGDFAFTLDFYLAPGSTVHVLSEVEIEERQRRLTRHRVNATFNNIRLVHIEGCPTNIHQLKNLPLEEASAILVMGEDGSAGASATDSASLASMLTIGALLKPMPRRHPPIICEILDPETDRMLAGNIELKKSATFFQSNALETGMFSLASSAPHVFNALLMLMQPEERGSIAAMPAELYFSQNELGSAALDFWELHARVRQRDELLVGWKFAGLDRPNLNPSKDTPVTLRSGDQVLVLTLDMPNVQTLRTPKMQDLRGPPAEVSTRLASRTARLAENESTHMLAVNSIALQM